MCEITWQQLGELIESDEGNKANVAKWIKVDTFQYAH